MGQAPLNPAGRQSAQAIADALWAELEAVGLERMQQAGGVLAGLSRLRSLYGQAMGVYGTAKDLIEILDAMYEAMTTPRRMTMRVASAHAFAYWVFQERQVHNPMNPPNDFLVMHRNRDQEDAEIGQRTGNPDFSSDGGLTSYDWNIVWRQGVQQTLTKLDRRMAELHRTGEAERALREALPGAEVHGQDMGHIASQYRPVIMARRFGRPEAAAKSHFVLSLKSASEVEQRSNISLYARFPYRG